MMSRIHDAILIAPSGDEVIAFAMIQNAMAVSWGSASFYFMLDSPREFPEGPHFSVLFYSVALPLVPRRGSVVGACP